MPSRSNLRHKNAIRPLHRVARGTQPWDELLTAFIEANYRIDKDVFFLYWIIQWEAVTKFVRLFFPNAKCHQLYQRWYRTLEPGLITGKYTDNETKRLCELVARYGDGPIDWDAIKLDMRRSTKSLRDRYYKYAHNCLVRSPLTSAERDVIEKGCAKGHTQQRITDDINARLRDHPKMSLRSVVDVENYLKKLTTYKPQSNPGRPGSVKKARHLEAQETPKTAVVCEDNGPMIDADNLVETISSDVADLQDTQGALDEIGLSDMFNFCFDTEPGQVAPSAHFGAHANVDMYAPGSQVPRDASVDNEPVEIEPASSGLSADLQHPSNDLDWVDALFASFAQHKVGVATQ